MKRTVLGFLIVMISIAAEAQVLPYVASDMDAVSMSMAGANIVETGSVATSAYHNAAAIPFADKTSDVYAGYTLWQPSGVNTSFVNVAGAYNLNSKFGFAVGFMYGMNKQYDVTDSSGQVTDVFSPSDIQLNVGFAWRFLPYLSAGVNVGYAGSTLAKGYSYKAFTSDIFLMSEFSDFKIAAGVSNLGAKVKSVSGVSYSLPSSVTLGAGYDKIFAEEHGLDVLLDADYYFTGGFSAAIGAGYTYGGLVSVRAGYRYSSDTVLPSFASVGVGVDVIGIKLNLAYLIAVSDSPLKNTLSVGLGYCF